MIDESHTKLRTLILIFQANGLLGFQVDLCRRPDDRTFIEKAILREVLERRSCVHKTHTKLQGINPRSNHADMTRLYSDAYDR